MAAPLTQFACTRET